MTIVHNLQEWQRAHRPILTGDVGDDGQLGDGGRDAHVDVHVVVGDERVPLPVFSGEVELLPHEAGHVRVTFGLTTRGQEKQCEVCGRRRGCTKNHAR